MRLILLSGMGGDSRMFAPLSVPDVELVQDVRVFGADPTTGSRGQATQSLDVAPNSLVFSYEHQVRVESA